MVRYNESEMIHCTHQGAQIIFLKFRCALSPLSYRYYKGIWILYFSFLINGDPDKMPRNNKDPDEMPRNSGDHDEMPRNSEDPHEMPRNSGDTDEIPRNSGAAFRGISSWSPLFAKVSVL